MKSDCAISACSIAQKRLTFLILVIYKTLENNVSEDTLVAFHNSVCIFGSVSLE